MHTCTSIPPSSYVLEKKNRIYFSIASSLPVVFLSLLYIVNDFHIYCLNTFVTHVEVGTGVIEWRTLNRVTIHASARHWEYLNLFFSLSLSQWVVAQIWVWKLSWVGRETVSWLYVLITGMRFLYVPSGLTFKNSTWRSLCVESFVRISEQTATFALYSIDWLVFITMVGSVYCAVRTDSLYKVDYVSSLKG